MCFHVIHYTFTWYFIVPLPLPPSPWLSRSQHGTLWVLVACWSFVWTWKAEAEMCNKIYVSVHEYFINIEHFSSLCIYYNSIYICSCRRREKNVCKFFIRADFGLELYFQLSRVTLFVLCIQVHFFCGLFHAFFE